MSYRANILKEVEETICRDRNYLYGKPEQSFDEIAKAWSFYLGIELKAEDAAIMLALFKVARMKTSVKMNKDNFLDAIGYMACAYEVAQERESKEKENVKGFVQEVKEEIRKAPECFGNFQDCAECLDFCWCQKSCKDKKLKENPLPFIPNCLGKHDSEEAEKYSNSCRVCLYEQYCEMKKNEELEKELS